MSESKSVWQKARRFPETKAQKTVTGVFLVGVAVALFIAGWVTQNREVQTWAIIGFVPLICGVTVLVSGLRKGGK